MGSDSRVRPQGNGKDGLHFTLAHNQDGEERLEREAVFLPEQGIGGAMIGLRAMQSGGQDEVVLS